MITELLSRLKKVRKTGNSTWMACCPAHPDKTPSLAIRLVEDGRILIYCHALCSAPEVVHSIGLRLSDLFPKKAPIEGMPPLRAPFPARDILTCIAKEAMLALVVANMVKNGEVLTENDLDRLAVAAGRLNAAVEIAAGGYYA